MNNRGIHIDESGQPYLVDRWGNRIDPNSRQGRRIYARLEHRANQSRSTDRAWYIRPPKKPSMRSTSGGLGSDRSITQGLRGQTPPVVVEQLEPSKVCTRPIHSHCVHTKALPLPASGGWGIAY